MRSSSTPKDHLLDLNGIEIAVRCWGDEGGIPVLALHGWLDNAASFERLAPLLDGCFVVAPDLVGHGRSDHRRHDSGYYLWEHAEDMRCSAASCKVLASPMAAVSKTSRPRLSNGASAWMAS